MADVLSSGREPTRSRRSGWRPRLPTGRPHPPPWLVVLVVAASLAGALRLWGGASTPPPRVLATPLPTGTVTPSPRPLGEPARFRLDGVTGNGPAGLRLLVGGDRPAVVDAATGAVTPLTGLPLHRGMYVTVTRLPRATGVAIFTSGGDSAGLYLIPDGGRPVLLGRDLDQVVAARAGGVLAAASWWNGLHSRLAAFTADGRLRWQRSLGVPTVLQRDTPHGLLIEVIPLNSANGGPLLLVDARTGTVRRAIGLASTVLDATDTQVAWLLRDCPAGCPLQISELATGNTERETVPYGWQPAYAKFSPRETMLAMSVPGRHDAVPARQRNGYVAVLSLLTGQLDLMPGLSTEAKQAATLAWTSDSRLVLGVYEDDRHADRMALWTPGHRQATVLPRLLPPGSVSRSVAVLPAV